MGEDKSSLTIMSQSTLATLWIAEFRLYHMLPSRGVFGNQAIDRALVDAGGLFRILDDRSLVALVR